MDQRYLLVAQKSQFALNQRGMSIAFKRNANFDIGLEKYGIKLLLLFLNLFVDL
jgi:hypothetical protein